MTVKKIILKDIKKSKLIIFAIIILNLLGALTQVTQPLIFRELFDEIFPRHDIQAGILYIILLVLVPVIFTLISSLIFLLNKKLANQISKSLRTNLFAKILQKNNHAKNKISNGEIINRLTSQVGQLSEVYLVNTFMNILSNTFLLIATLGVMFSMSIKLTLIATIALPLFMLLFLRVRNYTRNLDNKTFKLLDQGTNYLTDLFTNFKAVHIHNGQEAEKSKWQEWNENLMNASKKSYVFHHIILNLSSDLIISVITGIIYGVSLFLIMGEDITIGTLMAFIIILPRLHGVFKSIFTTSIDTNRIKTISNNLNEVLLYEGNDGGKISPDFTKIPNLEMNNLSFQYLDDKQNINNLNLEIESGMFVGIVGLSGSGKTTLFELLHKHISPSEGTIKINGINIEDYNTNELREYISYTPQAGVLWNRSILENIIYPYAVDELNDDQLEQVNHAIEMAKIDHFIDELPDQLNTIVSNNGNEFSGGEVQRILLARTFMNDSKMLLLDEYTSALDAITESAINDMLMDIKGKSTILVIAHRLSTIKGADLVIVMEDGKAKEVGTIPDLLKQNSTFKQMYQNQSLAGD